MSERDAAEVMSRAKALLDARTDAYIHLSRVKAAAYVRNVEQAFWEVAADATGAPLGEHQLTAILREAGVSEDQARRWSHAIVRDEEDDQIELTVRASCPHCGSGLPHEGSCGVCGQDRNTAPHVDPCILQARRIVHALVASKELELVSANAESAVVAETAWLLGAKDDSSLATLARTLEQAWVARPDVAEVYIDEAGILALLGETATPRKGGPPAD